MYEHILIPARVQTEFFHVRGCLDDCFDTEVWLTPIKVFDVKALKAMNDRFVAMWMIWTIWNCNLKDRFDFPFPQRVEDDTGIISGHFMKLIRAFRVAVEFWKPDKFQPILAIKMSLAEGFKILLVRRAPILEYL
jgi:hypothetical protein